MAPNVGTSDWRILAEQASKEMDGEKLTALVKQVCEAMDAEAPKRPLLRPLPRV
jgi:hypothetical protein